MSDENRPSLTYPAVLAGAVAAATATVLSTRLGLVGTVVGAVVASVVSTLVSTVFVRWLERTHDRVTTARDAGPRVWQRLAVGALAQGSATELGAPQNQSILQ